ncbi:MAG TPA: Ig-like domain repeat protein [Planctomycetota bacterium]|jgi:autotransporter-associated beta strand protein
MHSHFSHGTGSARLWFVLLAILVALGGGTALAASTVDTYDGGGSTYAVVGSTLPQIPSVIGGGPTGNFMRLTSANITGTWSYIGYNLTSPGPNSTVVADFDFRIGNDGRADGMGFVLLNTANSGATGAVNWGTAEEPNIVGALGFGFDIYNNAEINNNHISVHFNNAKLTDVDLGLLGYDLFQPTMADSAAFDHAKITVNMNAGTVSMVITRGTTNYTVFNNYVVPGLTPFECRPGFGARCGGLAADHDIDNVNIQYTTIATMTWNGSVSSDWSNPANWTPARIPANGQDVILTNGVNPPINQNITGLTIKSLAFDNTAGAYAISGSGITITATGTGVTDAGSGDHTLAVGLTFSNAQIWNIGAGRTLSASGAIRGPGDLVKNGPGTLVLGADSYPGATILNDGVLKLSSIAAPPVGSRLWLDATATASITKDANGYVSAWADKNAGGESLTQGNGGNQPQYTTSVLNGLPVVRFTGGRYVNNTADYRTSPVTILYVGRMLGTQNGRLVGGNGPQGVGQGGNFLLGFHGGYADRAYFEGWVYGEPPNALTQAVNTNFVTYEAVIQGAGLNSSFYKNGALLASNQGGTTQPNGFELGGFNNNNETSAGDIAEVLIYPRVLSDAERQLAESYLTNKWFGAIPPASPVRIAATAKLDLNGCNQTIASLSDLGGGGGAVINNGGAGSASLTISSTSGSTAFSGQVGVGPDKTFSLVKSGASTQVLSGNNAFTGLTTVNAGTLVAASPNALGDIGTGTTAVSGATLQIDGGVTLAAEPVTISGTGVGGVGALYSNSAGNVVNGQINIPVGSATIGSSTGALTINGNVNLGISAFITITGAGDTLMAGSIIDPYSGGGYLPGLMEGRIAGNGFNQTTPNPGGAVTLGARMGQTNAKPPWGDYETWVYTGQFYDADGLVSFAENIDDNAKVVIDGVQRLNDGGWNNETSTGALNLGMGPAGDGWHDIEIRFYNGAGGAGAVASATGWTANYGFGWDINGAGSTRGDGNVAPQDNGSMNLFRVALSALPPPTNSLTKTGSGTLTLSGSNAYKGGTLVSGGTMRLKGDTGGVAGSPAINLNANSKFEIDNSGAANPDRIANGATLNMNGGTLIVTAGAADRTETFSILNINSGTNTVDLRPSATGDVQLTAGSITHVAGSLVYLRGAAGGNTANLFTSSFADGASVPYATVNGQPAVYSVAPDGGVVPLVPTGTSKYTVAAGAWSTGANWNGGTAPGPNDDVFVRHAMTLDANAAVQSVTFDAGTPSIAQGGAFTLTIKNGVIVANDPVTLGSPTIACNVQAGNDLVISQNSASDMVISGAIDQQPAAYWTFDENGGTTVGDSSGNGHTGTLNGTMAWIGPGKVGASALQFDGATGYVNASSFPMGGAMTVAVWVNSANPYANWNRVFDFGFGAGNNNILIGFQGNTGQMAFHHYEGGVTVGSITCPTAFPTNTWVRVVLTVTSDGIATIYWDGVQQVTGNVQPITVQTRTNQYIGKSNWPDAMFQGMMDDFRIYNQAFTASELGVMSGLSATKTGPGRVVLSGANNIGRTTNVAGGTLQVSNALALSSTISGVTVQNGGALELSGGITIAGKPLSLLGTGTGNGALRNVAGNNSWAGTVTFGGPTQVNAEGASTLTLGKGLAGTGGFTKAGTGIVEVGGVSSYTGATNINAGTLRVVAGGGGSGGVFSNVPETANFSLVYQLAIPNSCNFSAAVPYSVDNSALFPAGSFSRVAYYMELQPNAGALQWVYTSFDAAPFATAANKLGVPNVPSGEFYHYDAAGVLPGQVRNMNVYSNVPALVGADRTNVTTGNVEFWPSNYGGQNDYAVPNANAGSFDFGDGGAGTGQGYGSMQIHDYGAQKVLFAFNNWNGGAGGAGIGNRPTGDPDWTFNDNLAGYAVKNLQILVQGQPVAIPVGSAVTIAAGAALDMNNYSMSLASLSGASGSAVLLGSGTLTAGTANTSTTFAGDISGTGGLKKAGTGTWTLSGNSTYSGPTAVTAGVLQAGSANALGQGAGTTTVNSNATLDLNGNFNLANKPITLNGTGVGGIGALHGSGGTPKALGTVTLPAPGASIGADLGVVLTVAGNVNLNLDTVLTGTGTGEVVIAGVISDPYGAGGWAPGLKEGWVGAQRSVVAQPGNKGRVTIPRAGEQYAPNTPDQVVSIWGTNETWIYTGQFYVPAGVTSVAFAGSIDDWWQMTFGNVGDPITPPATYINWAWSGNTPAITVTPNTWYDIDIRFSQGGGGAGPGNGGGSTNWGGSLPDTVTYPNLPWRKGFGYAFNLATPDLNGNNYTVPIENGSMNVFRVPMSQVPAPTYSVVKEGSGTLTLIATNTYSGQTLVSAGTLQLGNGSTPGTLGKNDCVDNATLAFNIDSPGTLSCDRVISGTGAVVKNGTGIAYFGGCSTYSGATTVNNGTMKIGTGGFVPANYAVHYSFDGGLTNDGTGGSNYDAGLNGAAAIVSPGRGGAGGMLSIPDVGSYLTTSPAAAARSVGLNNGYWTASVWFNGLYPQGKWRTLFRGSANNYDHPVIIQDTSWNLGWVNNSSPSAGGFKSCGFNMSAYQSGWHQIIAVGRGVATDYYVDGTLAGSSGSASIRDIWAIGNYQVYTGQGTVVSNTGTDLVGTGTNFTGQLRVGDFVYVGAQVATVSAVTDNLNATLSPGFASFPVSGAFSISGSQRFAQNIDDVYIWQRALSANEVRQFTQGAGSFSQYSAFNIAATGTLDLSSFSQTIGSLAGATGGQVLLGTASLTAGGNDASTTFAGVASGTGGLTKRGNGKWTLSGSSSYSGATSVAVGTVRAESANALGQGAGMTSVTNGATLELNGNFPLANKPMTLAGNGVGGIGALYSSGGTPVVTGAVSVADGGATADTSAGTLTIAGNVMLGKTAALTTVGAGNMVITGNINDVYGAGYFAGLQQGRLGTPSDNSPQPGNRGFVMLPEKGEQYAGGTPDALSGWGVNETWVYTGQFYVPAGVTTVAFAGNIDDGWYLKFNGAVVHAWAWGGHSGPITVTPNTWYDFDYRVQNGGGGAGAAGGNNWQSALTIPGYTAAPWYKGFGYKYNPANPNSDNAVDYDVPMDNGSMSIFRVPAALMSPPANSIIMNGIGALTLAGTNTYSYGTLANSGTLIVSANANLGSAGSVLTLNGATLQCTAAFNDTHLCTLGAAGGTIDTNGRNLQISGLVSGPGAFTKIGAGSLIFSANNTYVGPATVTAGIFQVDGLQAGSDVVLNGGTLGGSGAVGHVSGTGTLDPGSSAATAILRTLDVTLNAGCTFTTHLGSSTVPGTGFDQANVTGAFTTGGSTLNIVPKYVPAITDQFLIIDNDNTDAINPFAGTVEGGDVTGGGLRFQISYVAGSGNDVALTRILDYVTVNLISSANPSVPGQSIYFTATVAGNAPGAATPTGKVQFVVDGVNYGAQVNLSGGTAISGSITTLTAGNHTIRADYIGDPANFRSGSGTLTQVVTVGPTSVALTSSVNASVYGQTVAFGATVSPTGPAFGTPTGTVRFDIDGVLAATVPVDGSGYARYVTAAPLDVPSHTVLATYSGDAFFNTSNKSLTQTINKADTTTTLVSSVGANSLYGQRVILTATIAPNSPGSGTPTGGVTFTIAGNPATVALDGTGQAQYSTTSMALGNNPITAAYSPGANFNASSASTSVTVSRASTTLTVTDSVAPSVYGQAVMFTATVAPITPASGIPTGTVMFSTGANVASVPLDGVGQARWILSSLSVNTHLITASYSATPQYDTSIGTLSHTVNLASTTTVVTSSVNPSLVGQGVRFTATVTPNSPGAGTPTGFVQFAIDGANFGAQVPLSGNVAQSLVNTTLPAGSHTISASYLGDVCFDVSSDNTLTQQVNPASTTTAIASNFNPSVYGQAVTYTATVAAVAPGGNTPGGSVRFTAGATIVTVALAGGTASSGPIAVLPVGSTVVTADYLGTADYLTSTKSLTQVVNKADTTTVVASDANPSVWGQPVTLSATVTAVLPGVGSPSGSVTFYDGATSLGSAIIVGAVATLPATIALPVGNRPISAVYAGDGNFNTSIGNLAQTVNKAGTTLGLATSVTPSLFGQPVTFTATMAPVAPGAGAITGTVQFLIDGFTYGAPVVLAGGVATAPANAALLVGSHTIDANYSGDGNFKPSTNTLTQVVDKASTATAISSSVNASRYFQDVSFSVDVTAVGPGAGTPSGTVQFTIDTNPLGGPVALVGGKATSVSINTLPAGNHNVAVTYSGDAGFLTSNNGLVQVVDLTDTNTALVSSVNPSVFGQSVTFTATISSVAPGAGIPDGQVQFQAGLTDLGTVALTNGVASISTTQLPVGITNVTANYSNSLNYNPSNFTIAQTVNKADTGTVTVSSVNPSVFGQNVTFTATVTATAPGAGTPTGTVEFRDNGILLGTGNLAAGITTFGPINYLIVGNHPITAVYLGDGNFKVSTGPLTQVVNKADTATTVATSKASTVYGEPITFTSTVAAVLPGAGAPTGTVQFYSDGFAVGSPVALVGNTAVSAGTILAPGVHTIVAAYSGDGSFNTSNVTLAGNQTVSKDDTTTAVVSSANPSKFGEGVRFTATVSPVAPGGGTPTGTIQFQLNGVNYGAAVNLSGTSANSPIDYTLLPANYAITAIYSGDVNFNGSLGTLAGGQQVDFSATTSTISSSDNPSVTGEPVNLTARVSAVSPGAGIPDGTVRFTIDGNLQPALALDAGGEATLTTFGSMLVTGTHTVSVAYSGSTKYLSSNGTLAGGQVVAKADTSLLLMSSYNPSYTSQMITFTAVVQPVAPGSGTDPATTLTGSVDFVLDGGAPLTAAVDVTGQASVEISNFTAGPHTLVANYSGDVNYNITSTSLVQTVLTNNPPTIDAILAQTIVQGAALNVSAVGHDVDTLPPFNILSYSLTTAPAWVSIDAVTGVISGTALNNGGGTVIVRVMDGGGLWVETQFILTVTDVNDAPTLDAIADVDILEGATLNIQAAGHDIDPAGPNATLRYSMQTTLAWVTIDPLTGAIGGKVARNGSGTVTVFVSDSGTPPLSASQTFKINVTNLNLTPTIAAISPVVATEGDPSLTMTVTGTNYVSGAAVKFGGSLLPTTFVNATTLTALVPAGNLLAVGPVPVLVINPLPGGGPSLAQVFTINAKPVITSAPTATPNPAVINQDVVFSAAGFDPEGKAVTFTWNFADGTIGTGASVTHGFATGGTFNVVLTLTDVDGGKQSSTLPVSVSIPVIAPGSTADMDGDGFPDLIESAAGSDPLNPHDTPTGAAAGPHLALPDAKLSIKLNFGKPGTDSIMLAGTLTLSEMFQVNSQPLIVAVGGVAKTFVLDMKGQAKVGGDSAKVSSKGLNPRTAKFAVKLTKGQFADLMKPFGMTSENVSGKLITVPIYVMFGDRIYEIQQRQIYSAKAGRSGATKNVLIK